MSSYMNIDECGPLINALSLSSKGTTPHRWIVDMSSHEIGLRPHHHIFYTNPNEISEDGDLLSMSCQICFKQYEVIVSSLGSCTGISHHIHTKYEEESVSTMCCQCGSTVSASICQSTIPQSLLHRVRLARKPKSTNPNAPQFYDTIDLLIKIISGAILPDSRSINTESNAFKKIGLDESSKEFFEFAGFSFVDQRLHAPENTPANIQFLNRCLFQLQILLSQEKPVLPTDQTPPLTDMFEPAYQSITRKLGCATYERDPKAEAVDLNKKSSLITELQSPLGKLGCLSDMCDDLIIDAFQMQASHDSETVYSLMDVLVATQKARNSEKLDIEIACRRSEGIVTTAELRSAYMDFEIANFGDGISNEVLFGIIRALGDSAPREKIRESVMNMEAFVENENSEEWKGKVIDGRTLSRQDVAEAKEIVTELRNLFTLLESAKSRSVSPSSRLVELLLSTGKDGLTDSNSQRLPNESFQQQDVSETMSILMYRLNAAFQPVLSEKDGKPVDRFNRAFRRGVEIDSPTGKRKERQIPEDFSTLLLNVKEPTSLEELVDDYFDVLESDPTENNTDSNRNSNEEADVKGSEGMLNRDITVTELPPILQIHLMRAQYDRQGNTSYKSNANVIIPEYLFMDQFLESNQKTKDFESGIKRMKILKKDRREHLKVLETICQKRKEITVEQGRDVHETSHKEAREDGSLNNNEMSGNDANISNVPNQSINKELDIEELVQMTKVSDLTAEIKKTKDTLTEKDEPDRAKYKIHAVFHHEGGADFGHYWVYILDEMSEPKRWLKYSDDVISEVGQAQESEVFNGVNGSTACFCVYVRSGADVVQTVWRLISGNPF
ncbi:ubiquitin-specific protease ubp2 [Entomortierella beljakovae]|nr:ubiquitin-specific protease ubp2 [Entomortierella beljakovae]